MRKALTLIFLFITIWIQAQDFTITNFNIDLTLDTEGAYHVEETIDVFFTKRKRGIYRDIETTYIINDGKVDLGIQDIRVDGHDYKVTKKKDKVSIRIGNPDVYLTGSQQYRISYTIVKGIIDYENHQELYYDLTGNKWKAKIERVNFTIHLPRSITLPESDFKVTGGRQGQNLDIATIQQVDSKTIKGSSLGVLDYNSGITAAIKLPKRYLEVAGNKVRYFKSAEDKGGANNQNPWYIAIPLAIFAFFVNYWKKLRNRSHRPEDETLYVYPPEGLTSAHIGGFVDQVSNVRDIVSLLPYWASEGYLEMKQVLDDTYLYKKKNLDASFPEYEHVIFDKLFENRDIAKVDDLKTKFYTSLAQAQRLLSKEINIQQYYNQEYKSLFRGWKMILFPIPMFIIGVVCLAAFGNLPLGLGFILAGIGGFILPFFKLPLSEKGAKLKGEIDGFKKFLEDPDDKTLQEVLQDDPKYFETMLPFAIAFGLEKNFMKRVEPYMEYAPIWYHTDQTNRSFATFSDSFKPEVIQSAFSSAPQSSSGSYSGGGGGFSSGGGVGGGGGGSW